MRKIKPLPLVLSVKAANWRMNDAMSADADSEFSSVRKRALEEDDHTCRFCGFKAYSWMEVHHLNDDHADNRLENLITTCSFCHLVQHIGLAGINKEATLIWLPQIPQATLHHVVRTILVAQRYAESFSKDDKARMSPGAMSAAKTMADGATSLMDKLRSGETKASELIGTCDPKVLGTVLFEIASSSPGFYDKRSEFLKGIRLLPLGRRNSPTGDKMPEIIDSWLLPKGPYNSLQPKMWESLLQEFS